MRRFLLSIIIFFIRVKDFILGRKSAGSIGIIGGADGPTAIYTTRQLNPHIRDHIVLAMASMALSLAATVFLCLFSKEK